MLPELLWRASWQGTLFALGVWAVVRLFPKIPASARTTLWWLVCLKLVIGLLPISPIELQVLPAGVPANVAPAVFTPIQNATAAGTGANVVPSSGEPLTPPAVPLWLYGWGLGVAAIAAWRIGQMLQIRRLLKEARPLEDDAVQEMATRLGVTIGLRELPYLRESSLAHAPMVIGVLNPTILIPEGLVRDVSRSEIEMMLAHELAHVHRRDTLLAWIPMLATVFFFFLPPAWLAGRQWELEREAACDAMTLEATGASPASYGKLLLKLVPTRDRREPSLAIGATAQFHTLKKRLDMIKTRKPLHRNVRLLAAALIVCSALLVAPWKATAAASLQANPGYKLNPLKDAKAGFWNIDVKIPEFTDRGEVSTLANKEIAEVVREYVDFLSEAKTRSQQDNYRKDPPGWELVRTPIVTVAQPNLVSYYWEFTRCPDFFHETTYRHGATYGIVNGKAKRLEIEDLFTNGTEGHLQVVKQIYEGLKDVFPEQYAQDSQMPAEWKDWKNLQFSVAKDRIRIHFGKSGLRSVGALEENQDNFFKEESTYFVEIPFSKLTGLNPNGPLKGLIKG